MVSPSYGIAPLPLKPAKSGKIFLRASKPYLSPALFLPTTNVTCCHSSPQSLGVHGRDLRGPRQQDPVHIHPVDGRRSDLNAPSFCEGTDVPDFRLE